MKLKDLLLLMGIVKAEFKPGISGESTVIIMPEDSDGFDVKDVIYFQKEGQMWFTFDEDGDRWLTTDEEGPPDDDPVCEREGDMCTLPETSGDPCGNPFCKEGMTELGPCMRCNPASTTTAMDPCEHAKHKARRA